ncbi:MAG TPA: hypothetical protein VGZ48_07400 [Candidatus Acidoferrales bacterium]|nr:hypothetical protein [Candidatus Acidoferrales bacterium]
MEYSDSDASGNPERSVDAGALAGEFDYENAVAVGENAADEVGGEIGYFG